MTVRKSVKQEVFCLVLSMKELFGYNPFCQFQFFRVIKLRKGAAVCHPARAHLKTEIA